jgi:hypothetical protein
MKLNTTDFICDICGKLRRHGNHAACSKKRQLLNKGKLSYLALKQVDLFDQKPEINQEG